MDPALIAGGGLAGYVGWKAWRHKRRRRSRFPTDLSITDPLPTSEGVFRLGHYLPDEGEEVTWRPWDGGEQHLGIFGTTNSGKTVLARNLIVTAKERMQWDVKVADGAKGGIDFTFVKDSGLGLVVTKGAIPTLLEETAKEIERRATVLDGIRVPRTDPAGVVRAIAPSNLRDLTRTERDRHGLTPLLLVIDELAMLLAQEDRKKKPISGPLLRIAAAGRFVGIHLVVLMQRGDADLLDGFIGNLLRARILVGSTDQTAEDMAHGSAVKVWREMAEAAGMAPDGLERAMRPAGRAVVSGLAARPPGLVQLYRFDPITRSPTWDDYVATRHTPAATGEPPPPGQADTSPDVVDVSPGDRPPLRLVSDSVRSEGYAPGDRGASPPSRPPSEPPRAPDDTSGPRHPHRFCTARRRLWLRLGAWRWLMAPIVPDPARDPSLRGDVLERDGYRCACCDATPGDDRTAAPPKVAVRLEVDHRRPLWAGGADTPGNCQVLCRTCHQGKSRGEARVRAVKKRWAKRTGLRGRFPRPPLWQTVGVLCLAAGAIDGRWVGHALLLFAAVTIGPPLVRHYLIPKPFRRGKGGGLDGVSTLDAKLEQDHPGYLGATARGYYGTRLRIITARFAVMGASAAYVAGYWLPRYLL